MTLRRRLQDEQVLLALGAWDAMTAQMAEQAGAEAVYMSGSCVSTSVHGGPDVGLTTMTEMVERARQITGAIDVPLIADADTGYGNAVNVGRTVTEYERAGVNAIQLEDQEFPKKCGHFEGKAVIAAAEFASKIQAAVEARASEDFLVVARTDALAVHGMEEALRRARLYVDAGADVLFVESPTDRSQMETITEELGDLAPLLVNLAAKGKTPDFDAETLATIGYDLAIYPSSSFKAALKTIQHVYDTILETGSQSDVLDLMVEWDERDDITELGEVQQLEQRYEQARARYASSYADR